MLFDLILTQIPYEIGLTFVGLWVLGLIFVGLCVLGLIFVGLWVSGHFVVWVSEKWE